MPAFPYYDAADIGALNDQALVLLKLFAARGYTREEPSILQPADIFLDRSGEEIRRRTFTLTDPSGRELCLRPDLTIPICRHAVESKAKFPARLCYNGLAFRYQPKRPLRPTQFFQAGVELLGLTDAVVGETEVLSMAFESLRAVGLGDFEMRFGDLALFGALVDALELPPHWRTRLKRHFWRAGYVETLLRRLGSGGGASLSRRQIEARLDAEAGAPPAGRERQEVIARAMERAAEAATLHLDPAIAGAITKLFGISGPAGEALDEISALLAAAGITLDAPLAAMRARLKTIASLGVDLSRVRFTAHFGRNMEYYTGFVFELWSRDREGPVQVAGGGRYDTLMESLGAGHTSAIGCALRTERMLAARKFAGGA
ncbi:MAG TPA: ATP phosphoribosyltransferase regulatory subunit [Rhizomicrobium sp.]|jgi:ATP phosphoribosyltransferase regulatory subunit|nr:ATP phosphoribosyltransferase regulatory subunit [Rhizomicrobium sp.]